MLGQSQLFKLYVIQNVIKIDFIIFSYNKVLAQRGFFKDQAFINYIKYLQYWKDPEYVNFLMYPMCLYFLDLLQYEHFRREIVNAQCSKFIDDQAVLLWQHYTRRRIKLLFPDGFPQQESMLQEEIPTQDQS